ncbi:hypothetical protein Tco_0223798 [Tanacetum coccineum]
MNMFYGGSGFVCHSKLVSFDESQVVTFNSKFVCGFRNSDCEIGVGATTWSAAHMGSSSIGSQFSGVEVDCFFDRMELFCFVDEALSIRVRLARVKFNKFRIGSTESDNKTNDADDSDMDLLDDNPNGDDDAARFGASEVSLGIHVDVQATNILLQEMFSDENAYHTPSLPAKKIPYTGTTPQPSLLQAKAKKLMQKAKKNMRKINFKKVVTQKFREYDQKLEALINFNVFEAFKKVVQARVLAEIKKLLPTYILKSIANYVRPRLNTFVLDVMKNNQINLFTQSSTSTNDLSELDLKLKLLNLIHLNK